MIDLLEHYAVAIMAILLGVVLAMFLVLIFFAILNRLWHNRGISRKREASESIQPLIYSYLDGSINRSDFAARLKNKHDITATWESIEIMIDNLSGEERKKLQMLLDLPPIKKHFLRKLNSRKPISLAQACVYFSKKTLTDKSIAVRLSVLQEHSYNVIAYAATLALVNTTNQGFRDMALLRFLLRKNNASMAVSDIIFKYYDISDDKEVAAEKLEFFVMNPDIPDKTRAAVIRMFPELGFYQTADTLRDLLQINVKNDPTGELTAALLGVLIDFSDQKLREIVEKHRLWESPSREVRLKVPGVYADIYGEETTRILLGLAHDPELEVRMAAQRQLLKHRPLISESRFEPDISTEWRAMKKSGDADVSNG